MKVDLLESAKQIVKHQTKKFAKINNYNLNGKEISGKYLRAMNYMRTIPFGSLAQPIAGLVAILLDEEAACENEKITYVNHCMIVPIHNPNNHSYQLGSAFLVINPRGAEAASFDGSSGNCLPTNKYAIKPATEEEIDNFFARANSNFIESDFEYIQTVLDIAEDSTEEEESENDKLINGRHIDLGENDES